MFGLFHLEVELYVLYEGKTDRDKEREKLQIKPNWLWIIQKIRVKHKSFNSQKPKLCWILSFLKRMLTKPKM